MNNPFMRPTDVQLVQPKRTADGGIGIVVLERVEPNVTPEYCVHGKTACFGCDEWCWLGDKTYDVVASGQAAGLCLQCAHRMIPKEYQPREHVHDHRRADGPHE